MGGLVLPSPKKVPVYSFEPLCPNISSVVREHPQETLENHQRISTFGGLSSKSKSPNPFQESFLFGFLKLAPFTSAPCRRPRSFHSPSPSFHPPPVAEIVEPRRVIQGVNSMWGASGPLEGLPQWFLRKPAEGKAEGLIRERSEY